MPKTTKEMTNHPCHLLSLPSAKRFWCRHCMAVFEDAITRWRHSRTCRAGSANNFMRRRELEVKALQNTSVFSPMDTGVGLSIQMSDLASNAFSQQPDVANPSSAVDEISSQFNNEVYTCFICHTQFDSMEAMRAHVKYPCSSSKIITTRVPHPKHSMPVFIDELPGQGRQWQGTVTVSAQPGVSEGAAYLTQQDIPESASDAVYHVKPEPSREIVTNEVPPVPDGTGENTRDNITPTNIYVNDQGETVIEVENLDLNAEGGELSLAHLLTQLSQQGIVFDKTRGGSVQPQQAVSESTELYSTNPSLEDTEGSLEDALHVKEEDGQPTAEDAANTLAQLAGFRNFRGNPAEIDVTNSGHVSQSHEVYTTISSTIQSQNSQYAESSQVESNLEEVYSNSTLGNMASHEVHNRTEVVTNENGDEFTIIKTEGGDLRTVYDPFAENRQPHQLHQMQPAEVADSTPDENPPALPVPVLLQELKPASTDHLVKAEVDQSYTAIDQREVGHKENVETIYLDPQSLAVKPTEYSTEDGIVTIQPAMTTQYVSYTENSNTVEAITIPAVGEVTQELAENKHAKVDGSPDDFAIETVTLQEIVDSEAHSSSLPSQEDSDVPQTIFLPDPSASGTCSSTASGHSLIMSTEPSDPVPARSNVSVLPMVGVSSGPNPRTVYMVTSTGIQHVDLHPDTG